MSLEDTTLFWCNFCTSEPDDKALRGNNINDDISTGLKNGTKNKVGVITRAFCVRNVGLIDEITTKQGGTGILEQLEVLTTNIKKVSVLLLASEEATKRTLFKKFNPWKPNNKNKDFSE